LIARESLRAAYRILQEWRGGAAVPSDVLIAYERARVAERLGERAAAAADYQTVVSTWARADSVLHPVVTDAQRALTRLRSSRHATRVAPR
jgi:uncharacterized protein (DUF1800 family)